MRFLLVDPHIVVSAIQKNITPAFVQTDLSGYDYLKNLIHMPFYLQNSAVQKLHERLSRARKDSYDPVRGKVELDFPVVPSSIIVFFSP